MALIKNIIVSVFWSVKHYNGFLSPARWRRDNSISPRGIKISGFRQIGVGGLKFPQRLGDKGQSLLKFVSLVQINPSRPKPRRREKNKLNFYFHTSLWCLKRFYQGL